MQCISCTTEVSPNFVAAIAENKCPACGKQLMDTGDYKKIFALKKLLSTLSLGLNDPTLIKLAAAISSKFELWPKDSTIPTTEPVTASTGPLPSAPVAPQEVAADPALLQRQKQQMINKLSKAMDVAASQSIEVHELDEHVTDVDGDDDLSAADKMQLMKEYGLLNDTSNVNVDAATSPQMAQELAELMSSEAFPIEENAAEADRMARARGLKNQIRAAQMGGNNKFGIKPVTRLG
jgi:hypothetical protein